MVNVGMLAVDMMESLGWSEKRRLYLGAGAVNRIAAHA
jgi:hypothetical protein